MHVFVQKGAKSSQRTSLFSSSSGSTSDCPVTPHLIEQNAKDPWTSTVCFANKSHGTTITCHAIFACCIRVKIHNNERLLSIIAKLRSCWISVPYIENL